MVPGAGGASTSVNVAGRVEITRAPSPMLRPIAVSRKGRPISAPRGFNSGDHGSGGHGGVRRQ